MDIKQQAISDLKAGMPLEEFDKFYPELSGQKQIFQQYHSDIKAGMPDTEAPKLYPELFSTQEIKKTQPSSLLEKAKNIGGKITNVKKDIAVGLLKGAGSTLAGASELGEKYLLNPIDKIMGNKVQEQTGVESLGIKKALQPQGITQKIAFGAEQVAEFFVPGGAITKGTKALELASAGRKIGKAGVMLGKAGMEVGAVGGVSALQEGELNKNVATNALIAGAIPFAGKAYDMASAPVKKYLSEKIAPKIINSIIKPISKEFNFGRNAGKGVVEEGIVANTRKGMLDKITSKKEEIGKQMDVILNKPEIISKKIDINSALTPIDEAMNKAIKNGEQALYDRLKSIKDGMTKEFQSVEGKLMPIGDKNLVLSPLEAKQLKTELGQATKWTGQAFDNDVNKVRVQIYRNIDEMIDNAVPGIDKLNSRYANILSAENALDRTISIVERQNLVGLKDLGVGALVGGVGSAAQGNFNWTSVLAGILGNKIAGSTAVKSRLANNLRKLSPEEQSLISQSMPILQKIFIGLQDKGQRNLKNQSSEEKRKLP
ncbi:MAG: hypothetical protein ABII75_07950 [Candidatus Omnitrophota bacterium]